MAKWHDVREIPIAAAEYFRLQNDPDFEKLQARYVKYAVYRELSRSCTSEGYRRIIYQEPAVKAPMVVESFIRTGLGGKNFHLTEIRDVPNHGLQYHWKIEPPAFKDRVRIEGDFIVEPTGTNSCRRIIDGVFEIQLSGVGAMLAKFAAKEVTRGYDKVPEVAAAWLRGER